MENENMDLFGAILMERVRDISIKEMEAGIKNLMKDFISQKIYKIVKDNTLSCEEKILQIVPFTVDTTIHYFLWMIEDENGLNLFFDPNSNNPDFNINEQSDGLSGEIFGETGWINRFSKKGKIDY